jgi:hypothetical protein
VEELIQIQAPDELNRFAGLTRLPDFNPQELINTARMLIGSCSCQRQTDWLFSGGKTAPRIRTIALVCGPLRCR